MQICVTAEDIAQGVPSNPETCPVARAIRRVSDGKALVGSTEAVIHNKKVKLPLAVAWYIRNFDLGIKIIQPFSFDLEIP